MFNSTELMFMVNYLTMNFKIWILLRVIQKCLEIQKDKVSQNLKKNRMYKNGQN
jgi:hypothetical protein